MASHVSRNVRGVLFSDYVRMIRGHKSVDWAEHLSREDLDTTTRRIDPDAWYPMTTFERLGNAILRAIADLDLAAVRMWGRFSVDQLRAAQPQLVAVGDPVETLMRFRVLRATYFDFEAIVVQTLTEDHAQIEIHYYMGPLAEEAASHQALGFFERLLEMAGATNVHGRFRSRTWAGDAQTELELSWSLDR